VGRPLEVLREFNDRERRWREEEATRRILSRIAG